VTSVVRATPQVNGTLTTRTYLNRKSPNIAHVITSTISPHTPHLVKSRSPQVLLLPKVTIQFFFFLSLYAKSFYWPSSSRFWHAIQHSRRVVPFRGQNTVFSHIHPQNPPKPHFGAQMESLWEIQIRLTAWCIEIRCWNLAGCLILPSTWSIRKSFSVRGSAGG